MRNGVALIQSGGNLLLIGGIGFMIAIILVGMTSIMKGGKELPVQNVLLCALVWVIMFGLPPQNVILIDKYERQPPDVVQNVPFGIAVSQSVITTLGVAAANLMESAFSRPQLKEQEFGASLHAIVELRQLAGSLADPELVRVQTNAAHYISNCAPFLAATPNPQGLRKAFLADDAFAEARSNNKNRQVRYRRADVESNPHDIYETCDLVYNRIRADLDSDEFISALTRVGALNGRDDYPADLDNAYEVLSNENIRAVQQMKNLVIAGAYNQGIAGFRSKIEDPSVAAMMEPAIWQRNVQWAGEGDLFKTFVRPVITFIEGFIVAVTPMMALMIAASLSGIMLVFSYLKMTIWVQLWFPLLAIINLFLTMAMARDLDSVAAVETIKPGSIEASWGLIQTASTHIATAGMLAAAVPALAYALISMSPMAFTHLMGRLQGSDTVNEKILAPDVMTPSTGVKMDAVKTGSEFGGVAYSGAPEEGGTWSVSYADTSRLTQAQTHGYKAMENHLRSVGNVASRNAGFGTQWQESVDTAFNSSTMQNRLESVGQDETASFGRGLSSVIGAKFDNSSLQSGGFDVSASPTAMLSGVGKAMAASAEIDALGADPNDTSPRKASAIRKAISNLGAGLKEAFPNATFSYKDLNNYVQAVHAGESTSLTDDLSNLIREHTGIGLAMNQGLSIAARDQESTSGSVVLSEQDQSALTASQAELHESGQTWSELADSSATSQVSASGKFTALAQTAARQGDDYVTGLVDRATNLGLGATMHEAARYADQRLGLEGSQAAAYGALVAMAGGNNAGITATNADGAAIQGGRAAFGEVVRDLTGHGMRFSPVTATPPGSLGTTIERGEIQGQVARGVRPDLIPVSGHVDGQTAELAAGVGDAGALEAIVASREAQHTPYIDRVRDNMEAERAAYHEDQDVMQNAEVVKQYDEAAKMAENTPPPSGMELLGDKLNIFRNTGDDLGTIRLGKQTPFHQDHERVERHVAAIIPQAQGFEHLASGMAVGHYLQNWHADEFPTTHDKLTAAREFFNVEEDSLAWRQLKPMVTLGINGHSNPRSNAVKNVAEAVQSVDAMHTRGHRN